MYKKLLHLIFFAILAFCLTCAAQSKTTQKQANNARALPGKGNLPEASSALPLLSTIGAGALLGGLLSARRTRAKR